MTTYGDHSRTSTIAVAQTVAISRDVAHNVARHVHLASIAADHGAQMVVFPELSLVGYEVDYTLDEAIEPNDVRLGSLADVSTSRGIAIVAGAPIATDNGLVIGAVVLLPDGHRATHCKVYPHSSEAGAFVPGPAGPTWPIGDETVGLAICADITHHEHPRDAVASGATVYAAGACISKKGYAADAEFLRTYAVEYAMPVLLSNYGAPIGGYDAAGRSAVWSRNGDVIASAPESGEALVILGADGTQLKAHVVVIDS